ncbi:QRIC2 protein, partial [Donacobius atricapilla]|nr:QRIC2 protein [Donacobius atricapilla]
RTLPKQPCKGNPALAPILLARAVLQETKSELQKTEEQQEKRNTMLEQMVTETASQLNEQVRSWGSTPTTHWLGAREKQEKAKAECLSCIFDINEHLGELLQRCEKLQEQVDYLESRHQPDPSCSCDIFPSLEQDQKRLHCMEAKVVQIQDDCEKLSFASGSLQKDSQQKQKAIEVCGWNSCGVRA